MVTLNFNCLMSNIKINNLELVRYKILCETQNIKHGQCHNDQSSKSVVKVKRRAKIQ